MGSWAKQGTDCRWQTGAGTGGALGSEYDVLGQHLCKANIHFPVDWVLLRDGVKSLMQSVELIRSHGLKSRMCEPQVSITKINRLSMEMTHTKL